MNSVIPLRNEASPNQIMRSKVAIFPETCVIIGHDKSSIIAWRHVPEGKFAALIKIGLVNDRPPARTLLLRNQDRSHVLWSRRGVHEASGDLVYTPCRQFIRGGPRLRL